MDIAKTDKNFLIGSSLQLPDYTVFDAAEAPIEICGLIKPNDTAPYYHRLPVETAERISEGVKQLNLHTAGGRARFITDSRFVAISVKLNSISKMPHMTMTCSAGFDLYKKDSANEIYAGSFIPPFVVDDSGYESVIRFDDSDEKQLTIDFPLYSGVDKLNIILEKGSSLKAPLPYKTKRPILFYGSSITQGGCASRPGNSYQAMVSCALDRDYVNLGFSGNAKAEDTMSEYISSIETDLFVYDYDHNAPDCEHLSKTHEKLFLKFRESHPFTPVILMNRPAPHLNDEEKKRLDIIRRTYDNAIKRNDKNVYLIDMSLRFESGYSEHVTVDGCHPNDLGFYYMAKALIETINIIENGDVR